MVSFSLPPPKLLLKVSFPVSPLLFLLLSLLMLSLLPLHLVFCVFLLLLFFQGALKGPHFHCQMLQIFITFSVNCDKDKKLWTLCCHGYSTSDEEYHEFARLRVQIQIMTLEMVTPPPPPPSPPPAAPFTVTVQSSVLSSKEELPPKWSLSSKKRWRHPLNNYGLSKIMIFIFNYNHHCYVF